MPGLLGDVLPWVYSKGNKLRGLLSDPLAGVENAIADADTRAGGLLELSRASAQEGLNNGPATGALIGLLADSYNPAGMIDVKALQAKHPGIAFSLMQRGDGGTATLGKVVVPAEQRGHGMGSAFMRDLTQAADADRATLALSPSSDFGGSKTRLVEFYRRFGFVPNKGRKIDYAISESMYRPPK